MSVNTKKTALLLLGIILITPNLIWIFLDKSFWMWDLGFYATESIQLWRLLTLHSSGYLHQFFTMMSAKAPLLCWVGEFFSPLGAWIGYEKSFLLMQVLFSLLMLIEATRWKIFSTSPLKTIAVALMIASTPIFIYQSHFYFVELLQTFGVFLVWGLYLRRKETDVVYITCAYIALFFFLLGVKVTSPFYIFFPTLGLLHECWSRRHEYCWQSLNTWPTNLCFIFCLFITTIVSIWYMHNAASVYAFAKLASSGPIALLYGVKSSLTTKLIYWFSNIKDLFWGGRTAIAFEFLLIFSFLLNWKKISDIPFFMALFQILFIVLMMAFQVNEETRYIYPLFAYIIYIFGKTIIQNHILLGLFICIFMFRWVEINLGTLGVWPLRNPSQWSTPINTQGKALTNANFIFKKIDADGGENKNILIATDQLTMNAEGYQFKYFTQHPGATHSDNVYRMGFWFTKTTVQQALRNIQHNNIHYVITLPSAVLEKINDNLTKVTLPLTPKLRALGWTTLIKSNDYLVLKKPRSK